MRMETMPKIYQIRIQGKISERWHAWFDPLTVTDLPDGDTLLEGLVVDQSQLVGIINQLHNLNLKLLSVNARDDA